MADNGGDTVVLPLSRSKKEKLKKDKDKDKPSPKTSKKEKRKSHKSPAGKIKLGAISESAKDRKSSSTATRVDLMSFVSPRKRVGTEERRKDKKPKSKMSGEAVTARDGIDELPTSHSMGNVGPLSDAIAANRAMRSFSTTASPVRSFSKKPKVPKNKTLDKVLSESHKETGLDKKFVARIHEYLKSKILYPSSGPITLLQEDFINIFEGKLSTATVLSKMFRLLDKEGTGKMEEMEFFKFVASLKKPHEQELLLIFKAYDDDDSGQLEMSEFTVLLGHVASVLEREGKSGEELEKCLKHFRELLDPTGMDLVTKETFMKIDHHHHCLKYIIPDCAIQFESRQLYSEVNDLSPEMTLLFSMMQNNQEEEETEIHLLSNIKEKKSYDFSLDTSSESQSELAKIEGTMELFKTDSSGATLLHYAVISGFENRVRRLLNAGMKPNQTFQSGNTALHTACRFGQPQIVQVLLEYKAEINVQNNMGWTPLHLLVRESAINNANSIIFEELISRNANISLEDKEGCTVLDLAARYGQSEFFTILLKNNADVNHKTKNEYTPLHWAANNHYATTVKKLVLGGADVRAGTSAGVTPMHLAAAKSALNCMEQLYLSGASAFVLDSSNRTPLHMCVSNGGDGRCVRWLIKVAPEALKQRDFRKRLPRDIAEEKGLKDILSIIESGPLKSSEQSQAVISALQILRKNPQDPNLKNILKNFSPSEVNCANENGTTPLHYATMAGRTDLCEILLSMNANPNLGNSRATTPLHKAPQRGEIKCLIALLNGGGNINIQDEEDITPLHRALNQLGIVRKENEGKEEEKNLDLESKIEGCIVELIRRKAKVNISDHAGLFALEVAARFGLDSICTLLLENGAPIDHCSHNGWTPLHWACHGGFPSCAKLLIQHGAAVNPQTLDKDGSPVDSPLHLAVYEGHLETTKLLISASADLDLTTPILKQNIVHLATNSESVELLRYLLEELTITRLISVKDSMGNSPLHLARNIKCIELLLAHGANKYLLNKNGETPLLCAAKWGYADVVDYWIGSEANIHEKNCEGASALYLSCLNQHHKVADSLLKHGATWYMEKEEEEKKLIKFIEEPNKIYLNVAHGTMKELVNHASNRYYFDKVFVRRLLIGFRLFVSVKKFFQLLMEVYQAPNVSDDPTVYSEPRQPSSKQVIVVKKEKKPKIPPGVCAIVYYWMRHFWGDFERNREALGQFIQREDLGPLSKEMKFTFTVQEESSSTTRIDFSSFYNTKKAEFANFVMDYDAKLIAEHLTLIEEENLKRLRVKELVGLNWTKKEAEDLSPNVLVIVRHFNKMTSWVSTEILRKKSSRTQVIKKFIQIAQICLEMCNFSSLMVILSGLELTVITRLRRTWEEVKVKKCFKILEKIKNEFSLSSNYKNYRLLYQKCIENKKPFIPLLAVHLQDIVFIHEGNQDYTNKETETFNFEKITMFADSVHQLTLIQKRSYGLKVESPEFITDLVSCKTYTEKEAYEESLKIEPRKQN